MTSPTTADGMDTALAARIGVGRSYFWLKTAIDWWVALLAVSLATPIMVGIAMAIRRESPGRILFAQERAGRHGRPFRMLKFRTMRIDTDPYGESPTSGEDRRMTRVGRFLRETSLDELPQFFNVLSGDMALVGPRPLYLRDLATWTARQRCRLLVKPGLTGLAQIRGRGNLTTEQKLEWDVRYVERISLATDVRILLGTLQVVLRRANVYATPSAPTSPPTSAPCKRRSKSGERGE